MKMKMPEKISKIKKLIKKGNSVDHAHNALFIFRRDLRIVDNTALLKCSEKYNVCPIFIFTPEQVNLNEYKSNNAIQFMVNSLLELQDEIQWKSGRLHFYYNDYLEVIKEIISLNRIEAIFINKDYSPYSLMRDKKIMEFCNSNNILFFSFDDILLVEDLNKIKSNDNRPYYTYSHFKNKAILEKIRKPDNREITHFQSLKSTKSELKDFKSFLLQKEFYSENKLIALQGGRKEALKMIDCNLKSFKNYDKTRNFPGMEQSTTSLSAHNKFGTISIRELYYFFKDNLGSDSELIKQLIWRDFYYYLIHHFPETSMGIPLPSKAKYKDIKWNYNDEWYLKWCEGKTGFPFVDAGMRELNATGFMHNRLRMITAMFLTKDLILDWRLGEKYFSQRLIDIDFAQNVGNWMWCAGTGADSSPWLRIFNPWNQQLKFDKECLYIKKWIPELKEVPVKNIHNWKDDWKLFKTCGYPKPMIDHASQKVLALKIYGEKGLTNQIED